MARKEQTLDALEEMAWDACCRMRRTVEETGMVAPAFLAAVEKCHRMVSSSLKANPLGEEDLPDEELLLKLVETTDRLRRKLQRKQEAGEVLGLARRVVETTPEGEPVRTLRDELDS